MTARETLLALAARCEAATGADRELDIRIGWELDGEGYSDADVQYVVENKHAAAVTPYTASLDAAMTLVPEGRYWSVCNESQLAGKAEAEVGHHEKHGMALVAWCATPALALCAAALSARAESLIC